MNDLDKTKEIRARESKHILLCYYILMERWEDMLEFLKYIKMSNQLPYTLYAAHAMFA